MKLQVSRKRAINENTKKDRKRDTPVKDSALRGNRPLKRQFHGPLFNFKIPRVSLDIVASGSFILRFDRVSDLRWPW